MKIAMHTNSPPHKMQTLEMLKTNEPKNITLIEIECKKKKHGKLKVRPITEYFDVRRSSRKTKIALQTEWEKYVSKAIIQNIEIGLKICELPNKGRGIITLQKFNKNDYVLEYSGELITGEEAKKRENFYRNDIHVGCYMYYFLYRGQRYCVDATSESGRLGRLVNHSRLRANLITRVFPLNEKPCLIFIALRDIEEGEELLYDYGDRDKDSLLHHPWLAD